MVKIQSSSLSARSPQCTWHFYPKERRRNLQPLREKGRYYEYLNPLDILRKKIPQRAAWSDLAPGMDMCVFSSMLYFPRQVEYYFRKNRMQWNLQYFKENNTLRFSQLSCYNYI